MKNEKHPCLNCEEQEDCDLYDHMEPEIREDVVMDNYDYFYDLGRLFNEHPDLYKVIDNAVVDYLIKIEEVKS